MSIDAKGIQFFIWKIIRFSGNCCYKFVRTYPFVSGTLIFVLFLYICFPSAFYVFIYSSPILVCTAVSIRFYLKTKYPDFQWSKRKQDSGKPTSARVNRSKEHLLRPQKSVRRNARKEVMEWDRKDSEDRDILFPTTTYDSLLHKTHFLEENPELSYDGKLGSHSLEHGESSSNNEAGNGNENDGAVGDSKVVFDSETWKPPSASPDSFRGGQLGKVRENSVGEAEVESLEEGEDEEDDGNKAVQWTADDQKNLMDLGFSELERNRRLESLIAKRRARKLFKMAIERSLMSKDSILSPSQMAPILTAVRNNLLNVSGNPDEDVLHMPSSAPSILLPGKNPFDLPYDPLEEKPNLMADSFHQEFMMPAAQKDMFLCRHESFCRGTVYALDTTQDPDTAQFNPYCSVEKQPGENRAVLGFKRLSVPGKGGHHQHKASDVGSTDLSELEDSNQSEAINSSEVKPEKTIESADNKVDIAEEKMVSPHELEPGLDTRSEARMEVESIKNNDSCYSSSSEATDELHTTTKSPSQIISEHVRKTFNLAIPPRGKSMHRPPYDTSPSPSDRRRTDLALFCQNRRLHTPTLSIASDLQVEVSELGSPPTTDGTVSPADGDSVTYDGDVDRDINSDNEEIWGGSFNLTRTEANRGKQSELLRGITEEHSAEVEFSGLNGKPEEPIALPSPPEQEANQHLNSTLPLFSSTGIAETSASPSTNISFEPHNDVKQRDEEVEGFKTENPGETIHLMEKTAVHSPSEACFEKPQQEVEPEHKPTEDLNVYGEAKPMNQGDANQLDSQSSESIGNGTEILMQPSALGEVTKQAEATNLDSSEFTHGNLETSYESKGSAMEAEKEGQPSRHSEEDTQNLADYNIGNAPDAVQSRDDLTSVPDSIYDQNVTEGSFAGLKQRLGSSIARALNPRLVIQQTSVSSDASPRSVLPPRILADRIPISDVEQRIQTDVQQSDMEDIVRDSLADDEPHENLTIDASQNAPELVEHSIDTSSSDSRTLEGSSNMTEKTDNNDSTVHNMNELVEDRHGKEDFSMKPNEGSVEHHHEGGSDELIEHDSRAGPAESDKGNANADIPQSMEPTNSPKSVIEEGIIAVNINNSAVNEKEEGEKLTTNNSESQFSSRPEAPETSIEHEGDVNKTEANESENTSISETAREGEKSATEVDDIHDVSGSLANNVTNKETLNHVLDGEGDLQTISRQEAVNEPLQTTMETSAGSVEDTEQGSERLLDPEANAALSTAAEESKSLNDIKNGEEMQSLPGQVGVLEAPEAGEDNLKAIENTPGEDTPNDQTISADASKPRESEVKAVNPDEGDSNALPN